MKPNSLRILTAKALWCILLATLASGCGDGGGSDGGGGGLRPLQPGDPAFGTAGQALVSDRGLNNEPVLDQLWISFAGQKEWSDFLEVRQRAMEQNSAPSIGGRVVADAERPLGFYFDPATTIAAEVVAETFQTSLDGLKQDPAAAAAAGHVWYVAGIVEQTIPGTESARTATP